MPSIFNLLAPYDGMAHIYETREESFSAWDGDEYTTSLPSKEDLVNRRLYPKDRRDKCDYFQNRWMFEIKKGISIWERISYGVVAAICTLAVVVFALFISAKMGVVSLTAKVVVGATASIALPFVSPSMNQLWTYAFSNKRLFKDSILIKRSVVL